MQAERRETIRRWYLKQTHLCITAASEHTHNVDIVKHFRRHVEGEDQQAPVYILSNLWRDIVNSDDLPAA